MPRRTRCPARARPPAALHDWRDATARRLDESTGYVLPRAQLVKLAQAMPKTPLGAPRRAAGLRTDAGGGWSRAQRAP